MGIVSTVLNLFAWLPTTPLVFGLKFIKISDILNVYKIFTRRFTMKTNDLQILNFLLLAQIILGIFFMGAMVSYIGVISVIPNVLAFIFYGNALATWYEVEKAKCTK
jgi:hypothetical protein